MTEHQQSYTTHVRAYSSAYMSDDPSMDLVLSTA